MAETSGWRQVRDRISLVRGGVADQVVAHVPRDLTIRSPLVVIGALFLATRGLSLFAVSVSGGGLQQGLGLWGGAWDSGWYLGIILSGYGHSGPQLYATGFYPGWPLLGGVLYHVGAWVLHLFNAPLNPVGAHVLGSASLVFMANLCLVVATWALWRLYEPLLGRGPALAGLGLFLAAPGSFFLSAGYAESSFVAATALAFLCAHRGRWIAAGAAVGAASLIRPYGPALVLPLWFMWLAAGRRPVGPAVVGAFLAVLGTGLYPLYTWMYFGDPLLYVTVHRMPEAFGATTAATNPVESIAIQWLRFTNGLRLLASDPTLVPRVPAPPGNATAYGGAQIVIVIAQVQALLGGLLSWITIPRTHALWAAIMIVFPLATDAQHISLARFALAAWPAYFALGCVLRRWPTLLGAGLGASAACMGILSYGFARFLVG